MKKESAKAKEILFSLTLCKKRKKNKSNQWMLFDIILHDRNKISGVENKKRKTEETTTANSNNINIQQ